MKRVLCAVLVLAAGWTVASAQIGLPDANTWQIDPGHSTATFAVRHMLVATVRGTLGPVSGTVTYDGKNIGAIQVTASIDARKLNSQNDARDKDLRGSEFFAVDQYPNVTFKSKRAAPGADGHFTLVGDLTIRTTTREVTLDVEGPLVGPKTSREQRLGATATTTLNRFDYGLKWNALIETGGAVVGPEVKVTLDIEVFKRN